MSRRDQIQMNDTEVADFLATERTIVCATNGPEGWPHLMPLWYVVRDGELWAWTFAKSQKIKNLERDPRATLQVETGSEYQELRGVMLEAEAVLHRERDDIVALGLEIFTKYSGGGVELPGAVTDVVRQQATKRVGLQFVERGRATWDHRKLNGKY
jgi:general stress protein 26